MVLRQYEALQVDETLEHLLVNIADLVEGQVESLDRRHVVERI